MLTVIFFISLAATIIFVSFLRRLPKVTGAFLQHGVPAIGGLSIGVVFFIVAPLVFLRLGLFFREIQGILLASFFIFVCGIIDDRKNLSVLAKVTTQVVASLILILFGVTTRIIFIGPFLNILVTIIWVIGITNTFNHLDILDGLTAVVSFICISALLLLASFQANVFLVCLYAILLGCLCGFLKYNLPDAQIYLGNTGSHFLGFIIAAAAIMISYAGLENKIALISPILILGLPIFDTGFVIIVRLARGKSPFMKSNDHIATRLQKLGLSKWRILLFLGAWGLLFAFSGVSLVYFNRATIWFLIAVLITSAIAFLYAVKADIND